ncbi:serine hydrolase domain-containing protein [Aquimarina litoralis]|uniref:serine hydrolase domain-containing protein n=1 Tax=Aquimarina litoralis TaxID=584605 RepID=UPI001C591477|nr:serine hydrolase [Aquimarina litoralis]MBW1294960.1 serine hydrolase [Aquimarina litoralis]
MYKNITILVFIVCATLISCAQSPKKNYQGEWVGHLPDKNTFNFKVTIEKQQSNTFHLTIANDQTIIDKKLTSTNKDKIHLNVNQQLFFELEYEEGGKALVGFIKSGKFLYRTRFQRTDTNRYEVDWNPFMVNNSLQSDDIDLYVEHRENGNIAAYPFFGDQRFRGAWTKDFKKEGNIVSFKDGNTGFNFRAKLLVDTIELEILLTDVVLTKTTLTFAKDGWEYTQNPIPQVQNTDTPKQLDDGWATANCKDVGIDSNTLETLISDIHKKELVNTHSILIAKKDTLVFETYFDGFNADIPHDLRSASKSISSAVIGIAIDDQIIESVDQKLYDFVPQKYQYTKDASKSKITLQDLLTMSGGLAVNKEASENTYQNPSNPNSWLQTVLEAPMVKEAGTYADYGSANPFLLGICLNERLNIPLENYMDEKLFAPLGIRNYINQTDDSESVPYFGGGMLLTPRDLLKFGQLYLNNGKWKGQQIISEKWVQESFGKYRRLQDYDDKNEYGYLWWHDDYEVKGKNIEAIEARGAGGQFIFILPALETVVVITSGNFRNRKGNQPRDILQKYILPAIVN